MSTNVTPAAALAVRMIPSFVALGQNELRTKTAGSPCCLSAASRRANAAANFVRASSVAGSLTFSPMATTTMSAPNSNSVFNAAAMSKASYPRSKSAMFRTIVRGFTPGTFAMSSTSKCTKSFSSALAAMPQFPVHPMSGAGECSVILFPRKSTFAAGRVPIMGAAVGVSAARSAGVNEANRIAVSVAKGEFIPDSIPHAQRSESLVSAGVLQRPCDGE